MRQTAKALNRKPSQIQQQVLPQQLWIKLNPEQQEAVWQRLLWVCQQHLQNLEMNHES